MNFVRVATLVLNLYSVVMFKR